MELPKDLRFISLKYAGLCRACATSLKVGERAHWSPSSKEVWCIDCASAESSAQVASDSVVGSSRNAIKNASSNSALNLAANRSHTPWQKLCVYAQRCIEAEAAKSLVPYVEENSLWFLHSGQEKLVVGQDDSTPASGKLANRLSRIQSRDGRSIIYGWPTVVVIDRDHKPKIAPLFVVHIESERNRGDKWELHATGSQSST